MDELWQKYRVFWVPVLYGVGAFLLGLIIVHIFTDDPDAGRALNDRTAKTLSDKVAPSSTQIRGAKDATETMRGRIDGWAKRLDQRHGEATDPIEAYLTQAYRAAVLRGTSPADVARFDGDSTAMAQASARYEQLLKDRLALVRAEDPNVSFSRIRADVVQELLLRANRADVDLGGTVEELGFTAATIPTVDRVDLPKRLANLALVATVLDVAIREGVRSIDGITLLPTDSTIYSDSFLALWPVKVDVTGPPAAVVAVLNTLTDPERPTPMGSTTFKRAGQSKDGLVRAEFKVYSVRVNPEATLGLEAEGAE